MVYDGCDTEYAEQVTAEHKINTKSGKKTIQKWVPKRSHIDNHYLDAEVYALAAADIRGVTSLHLDTEEEPEKPQQEENPNGPASMPFIPDRNPKPDHSRPVTSATDAEGTSGRSERAGGIWTSG